MRSGRQPTKMAGRRPLPSRKKANAIGFMKRQSKKSQSLRDVYEYEPSKARRSKVDLELDEDEAKGFGEFVDGEGNDDEARGVMHARLIGENDNDEGLASEDDEELDSDAAFEESDEERFAGFKFASERKKHHTSKPSKGTSKVRFTDVDLNEDNEDQEEIWGVDVDADSGEEEDDDDDPSEFIDVLDILDGKGEMDTGSDFGANPLTPRRTAQEDDDSEEEEEEGLLQPILISDDEDDNIDTTTALDDLQKFVSKLDPSSKSAGKRKADGADSPKPAKRRQVIKERTEAGTENEFGAYSAGKLNIDDLLAPLAGSSSSSAALTSLQKSAKVLRPDVPVKGNLGVESTKSKKPRTLSAPLPQRTQDRLDRQAAYEQTKGEVDKWSDSMKRIREAEHLSFPLQPEAKTTTSNLELASRFKPTTELETGISKLLQSARLREEDIAETEDNVLKAQDLSVEEVATRRAELRRMRELMFRAEVRARRIKKIKSKTYRRLRRKEKEKLDGEDGDGGEDEGEAQLRREVGRARERATLRHKNTGKWAKSMSGKHGLEQHQRLAIEEMLGRGEKLRRKIQGKGSDSEHDEQSGDESTEEIGEEDAKARAFEELARLNDEDSVIDGGTGKGVFEMKFMKDAMIRQLVQADRERDDFVRELGLQGDDPSGDNVSAIARDEDVTIERNGGRIAFKPGAPSIHSNLRTVPASDTSSVTLKSTDLITPSPVELRPPTSNHSHSLLSHSKPADDPSMANPWLGSHTESSLHAPRKRNEVVVSKTSAAAEKSKSKLKKQAKKLGDAKIQAMEDAEIEISIDKFLGSAESAGGPFDSGLKRGDDDDEAHSEVEEQEKMLSMKQMKGKQKASVAFEQRDLVALAFAGDNVVQQFDEVKRREMAADAPHEVDTTLPGWGSWGGTGSRKQAPKPHLIKKVAGIDPKTRADYGKSHVIISEKRDKKAAKYLVKDLPYPYTSKAQFERGMATPLGAEWNTRLGFQKGTLPKIVKKMGTVINPLEKLF